MKLHTLLIMTHGAAAATSTTLVVAAMETGSSLNVFGAAVASLASVAGATWHSTRRIRNGLKTIESAVADHENAQAQIIGIDEFDDSNKRIAKKAGSWEAVAAQSRRQSQEVQSMMAMLNRRGASDEPSTEQLRELLSGLGHSLHSHLEQIQRGAVEIEGYTKAITGGVESQGHAVIKTTTYVDQLSSTIDSVSSSADAAQSAIARTNESATAALQLVHDLTEGMKKLRTETQTSEKKLLGLGDPSQQISAIVGTISDITAQTELLALNASIESIRAGEHGRGFAIVADEVRKLAEQASDATREINSLVDSMQLVTQESIRGIARQREQVESEFERAVAASQSLEKICSATDEDTQHVEQITSSSTQQLQLAQDVVLAVEQISEIAKANRGGAESVCWTIKSLSKTTPQLTATVDRLRACGSDPGKESRPSGEAITPTPPITMPVPVTDMAHVG